MANRYWRPGGNGIWSSNTNWSTTKTGATGQTAPGASDIAYFTDASGTDTITIDGNKTFQQLNCTGYSGTWQANGEITVQVTTHLKLSPTMSFGTQFFTLASGAGTANINFDGATFPYDYLWNGTGRKTIQSDIPILGQLRFQYAPTLNGAFEISCYGLVSNNPTNATPVTMIGTCSCRVYGGTIDRVIKSGGSLYLDGDISIPVNSVKETNSSWGIKEGNLEYVSGTITIDLMAICEVSGTGTFTNLGENVKFGRLSIRGSRTIDTDIYVREGIASTATESATLLSNTPKNIYVATEGTGDVIFHNAGTFISDTVTMVYKGTGTFFSINTWNNVILAPVNPLQINFVVDTNGTLTFKQDKNICRFYNMTFKWVKGTVISTGAYIRMEGNATLDLSGGVTLETVCVDGGDANFISDATVNNLYIYNSGAVYIPNNGAELTVTNTIEMKGIYGTTPAIVATPLLLKDMQGRDVVMNDSKKSNESNRGSFAWESTGLMSDWTFAFDFVYDKISRGMMIHNINSAPFPNHYWWVPTAYVTRLYWIVGSSALQCCFNLTSANFNMTNRIVITKRYEAMPIAYINGNKITVYMTAGSSSDMRKTESAFSKCNQQVRGDVLVFKEEKDQDWVTSDYNKFLDNDRSSNGCYDATEPNLFLGMHTDYWTPENIGAKIKFTGDINSAVIAGAKLINVDASGGTPLLNWQGNFILGINAISVDANIAKSTKASYA